MNQSLENYRFDDAANTIYQFFWGSFCDWYLEIVKLRLDFRRPKTSPNEDVTQRDPKTSSERSTTLVQVFECALRLLSPFMPFITEELWHAVYDGEPSGEVDRADALSASGQSTRRTQTGPKFDHASCQSERYIDMSVVQNVITALRALRKDAGVAKRKLLTRESTASQVRLIDCG